MDDENDHMEEQSHNWDVDSAIGDIDFNEESSVMSLTPSVLAYREENGRRYHAFRDGQYFMPNDALEQQGMDMMHHLSQVILKGRLFRAPIVEPRTILDIGTGTGIWAIDVADQYPAAAVVATDLSPIQPTWVPPNLEFQLDDCESPWSFNGKFDFIHMRNLSGAIADWPQLLRNCYDHLNPGGWIEVSNIEAWGQSANSSITAESASFRWQENLKAAASAVGRELNIAPQMAGLLENTGFEDVFDEKYKWPMSPWLPGRRKFSTMFGWLVEVELEALTLRLYTQVLQWPVEKVHALLNEVRREIINPNFQMYSDMHYICGRKPNVA